MNAMGTTAVETSLTSREGASGSKPGAPNLTIRFALVALAVAGCYLFRWEWLRFLTSEANLLLDRAAGLRLERLSFDTVRWHGNRYQYQIACTFADVWCGAVPLLWS